MSDIQFTESSLPVMSLTRATAQTTAIIFYQNGKHVVTIHPDGHVTWTGDVDAATKTFWSSLQTLLQRTQPVCKP